MIFFVKSDFLHRIHVIPTKFTSGMHFCEEPNIKTDEFIRSILNAF